MMEILLVLLSLGVFSTSANDLTGYTLIHYESEDDVGSDEYPSIYLETKSLKKVNGIVTGNLLEKYNNEMAGYKIKFQMNCKAKTYKTLDAVWSDPRDKEIEAIL